MRLSVNALRSTRFCGEGNQSSDYLHEDLSFRAGFSREEPAVAVGASEKQIPHR